MTVMFSRFSGRCAGCSTRFPAGAPIEYNRSAPRGKKAWCQTCADLDPAEIAAIPERDPIEVRTRPRRNRSIEIRTSTGTYYQNANGKCEDAPCCGCCTF
jgi:hypothetical protein